MPRDLRPAQLMLDPSTERDQVGQVIGHDPQSPALGRRKCVNRTAVGYVDLGSGGAHAAGDDIRRNVAKRHTLHQAGSSPHARDDAAGGHVDRDVDLTVLGRPHPARFDRPGAEGDRPVAARGRVAVLVPEQDPQVCATIVGRHEETAVHVRVPARLVAEEPAHAVDPIAAPRVIAPVANGRPADLERGSVDDPKRLAGGVVVGRLDLDLSSLSYAAARWVGWAA